MNKESWVAVINPSAGGGRCIRDWPTIESYLNKYGVRFEPVFTTRNLHAAVISRKKVLEGHKKIMVIGGDGTLNEVVNGILCQQQVNSTDITLGMIPVGTGNDWARMFDIPFDYERAIQTLLRGKTFIQDAGRVLFTRKDRVINRYFLNIAGIGFDAMVTERSNRLKKKGRSNKLLYFWNIFTGLYGFRHFNATLNVDGHEKEIDIFSMNIGICQYSGGGMKQVPDAIPDDGIFDLTVIKKIGKFEVLRSIPKLYDGQIKNHRKVESYNGRKISIKSKGPVFLETDGENLGHSPFEFEILPRSLKVIRA